MSAQDDAERKTNDALDCLRAEINSARRGGSNYAQMVMCWGDFAGALRDELGLVIDYEVPTFAKGTCDGLEGRG